ncbi:cache domain-containing protein [Methanospirillum hungatei]|uniref:cache domain-containing protein n=1 Tax=Methanospirillum hungatei TaxID=2203 RepID=UPI0026EDD625|nr:cache domain-containing protein [Methanospirillum hungatei]MCA1916526.1 cache domain-containing protein [Methanospirillum hungatei]
MSMKRWFVLIFLISIFLIPAYADDLTTDSSLNQNLTVPLEMVSALDRITGEISDELAVIKEQNRISAESLRTISISGDDATSVLERKLETVPYGHSSLIISPDNIITAAAPTRYSGLIGTDLSYQPETRFANEKQEPVISNIFYLEEGFYGISISYPIFSEDDEYLGYTDITIRPEEFFRPVIGPFTEQTGYEVFILQTDGMTVYETDEVEIGRNVLTDPIYDTPEMRNVSHAVLEHEDGTVIYTFWDKNWKRQVPRQAIWNTLSLDNQEWRVAVVRNLEEAERQKGAGDRELGPDNLNASLTDLTQFVQDAAIFARTAGQESACDSFNNLSGPYVSGDRYIFAYTMNSTTLALPYQLGLLGKERPDLFDVNGFAIMPALIDTAVKGGGFMYGVYPNPDKDFQNLLKIYYIEPVDSDWFIGSGLYIPWITAEFGSDEIHALIGRVKQAVSHAEKVGKEQAIMDFNDLNQSFADGGSYIFAYGYDGTTLALPHQPELIGTNRMNFTDVYGVPVIYLEKRAAERGGGFVYIVYYNPDSGNNELKLCYVLPAGEDWFVGSGIYLGKGIT